MTRPKNDPVERRDEPGNPAPPLAREWLAALLEETIGVAGAVLPGDTGAAAILALGQLLSHSALSPTRADELFERLNGGAR